VNTSPREAETERCPAEEFLNRFGLKQGADAPAQPVAAASAAIGTELADSEFWPAIASLLLIVLVLESLVANRTAA
jgi:3-oxoacyl-ACP reductase-like protein